jgi:hypothetical protein
VVRQAAQFLLPSFFTEKDILTDKLSSRLKNKGRKTLGFFRAFFYYIYNVEIRAKKRLLFAR